MNFKKVMAATTAVATMTSMLGMTAFATEEVWDVNGGKQTVEGEAWVQQPTIEVELPGDLAFGINPLKLNVSEEEGKTVTNQIVSDDFVVTNYSDIPVAVTASTFVSGKGDKVELAADADWNTDTNELKPSSTAGNKSIWLVQLYPDSIATSDSGVTITYTAEAPGTDKKATIKGDVLADGTDESSVTTKPIFVLKAWTETVADQKDCIAAFKFGGAVDPNATFEDGDVKVKTVFELGTLTNDQITANYEAYKTSGNVAITCPTIMKEK